MATGGVRGFSLHAACCALCWLHGCGVNVAKSAAPKQQGSGGGVEEKHWRVTRWGERRPWCAPCASLSGGRNQKKKKEGSGTGPRARVKSRQGAGKGEKTNCASEQGECGIAKRELNAGGSRYRQCPQVSMRA